MRAKLCVPAGGLDHSSGGEMSGPSQVYLAGIKPPGSKARLLSSMR
ncbi:MAG: hypothetical protein ACE5I9_09805 [Candidatus Methylomirabilales bacterium]